MSELIKWFERRKETKALMTIQSHLALTTGIVEDLEEAINAAIEGDCKKMQIHIERVTGGEREADALRRKVMDEISKGELPAVDRADLMDLIKRVDMIADWSRESTRILGAMTMEHVPASIKKEMVEMVKSVKGCAVSLQKCVNKMMVKHEEAFRAADMVEREEEKVDDLYERVRKLLGREEFPRAGLAILTSQLFEAIEMIADACEDACDQVRVIIVRK